LIFSLSVLSSNACLQTINENKTRVSENHAPMDFMEYNGDLNFSGRNGNGIIKFRCYHGYSDGSENPYGNAQIYMIHKNGGDWWLNKAKELNPDKPYSQLLYAEELYKSQDSTKLNDYCKWAFYIDKKYLKAETSGGGEKDVVYTSYFPTYPYTVVLYEQKAGSDKWVEIDRKTFQSEEEKIKENCEWECGFYNNKLKELNEKFKK
jgi:hypothetical protein